jgi:hypothetical protein
MNDYKNIAGWIESDLARCQVANISQKMKDGTVADGEVFYRSSTVYKKDGQAFIANINIRTGCIGDLLAVFDSQITRGEVCLSKS